MTFVSLGIMTGTSCDGINGAVLRTDGQQHIERLKFVESPLSIDLASELRELGRQSQQSGCINLLDAHVKDLEQAYTEVIIDFVINNFDISQLDLIGFHGQTVLHLPHKKQTVQLGLPDILAKKTQTNVIFHFRQNDLEHGGQGAPLAPLYHQACMYELAKPSIFINIGGVSNVTYDDGNHLLGFDIGPGNCISDDLCQKYFNQPFDINGEIAASGEIDYEIAHKILQTDIFVKKPPKSFDRNEFDYTTLCSLNPQDAIATANYMTAKAIIDADQFYPQKPELRIIAGGGIYNKVLIQHLENLSDVSVKTADEIGLNSNAIEAECFAWLAVRSIKKLPLSIPSVTGVFEPVTGGELYAY